MSVTKRYPERAWDCTECGARFTGRYSFTGERPVCSRCAAARMLALTAEQDQRQARRTGWWVAVVVVLCLLVVAFCVNHGGSPSTCHSATQCAQDGPDSGP